MRWAGHDWSDEPVAGFDVRSEHRWHRSLISVACVEMEAVLCTLSVTNAAEGEPAHNQHGGAAGAEVAKLAHGDAGAGPKLNVARLTETGGSSAA